MAGKKGGNERPVRTGTLPPYNSKTIRVTSGDVPEV